MKEANDILPLLDIPSEKMKSYLSESNENNSVLYIELIDFRKPCPKCGSTLIETKGYYKVRINNLLFKHQQIYT